MSDFYDHAREDANNRLMDRVATLHRLYPTRETDGERWDAWMRMCEVTEARRWLGFMAMKLDHPPVGEGQVYAEAREELARMREAIG